jgi:hypothetical protein
MAEYKGNLIISGGGLGLFNLENQTIQWINTTNTNLTCPSVLSDRIYVRKRIRNLYVYDLKTGQIESRVGLDWFNDYSTETSVDPIIINNLLVIPKTKSSLAILQIP